MHAQTTRSRWRRRYRRWWRAAVPATRRTGSGHGRQAKAHPNPPLPPPLPPATMIPALGPAVSLQRLPHRPRQRQRQQPQPQPRVIWVLSCRRRARPRDGLGWRRSRNRTPLPLPVRRPQQTAGASCVASRRRGTVAAPPPDAHCCTAAQCRCRAHSMGNGVRPCGAQPDRERVLGGGAHVVEGGV